MLTVRSERLASNYVWRQDINSSVGSATHTHTHTHTRAHILSTCEKFRYILNTTDHLL